MARNIGKGRFLGALLAASLLAGCQTAYQEEGFWTDGGVSAQQVTSDTFRITARGNEFTDQSTISDYVLLKSAETVKAAGFSHFGIVSGQDITSQNTYQTSPGTFEVSKKGKVVTFQPPTYATSIRPGQQTIVQGFNPPPGEALPPGTYSADEIIRFIGSRVERPS